MKRVLVGLGVGFVQGILYILPMVLKGDTWRTNVPSLTLWITAGFFIATSNLKLHPVPRGILISFIAFIPSIAFVVQKDPWSLLTVLLGVVTLGAIGGFVINRVTIEID